MSLLISAADLSYGFALLLLGVKPRGYIKRTLTSTSALPLSCLSPLRVLVTPSDSPLLSRNLLRAVGYGTVV